MSVFRNCVKELREMQNLTQKELADLVGCSRDNIGRLERNEFKNPSLMLAYRLAVYFQQPLEKVFWLEET